MIRLFETSQIAYERGSGMLTPRPFTLLNGCRKPWHLKAERSKAQYVVGQRLNHAFVSCDVTWLGAKICPSKAENDLTGER